MKSEAAEGKLVEIPTVSVSISFHLYVAVGPDCVVHYVKTQSKQTPPCPCKAYCSFCHQFLFLCSLPVSPCCYCILSFSVPQLCPFLSLIHSLPFCLCPRVHRGHQTMAAIQLLYASCADWHCRDSVHVVPCCWYTWRGKIIHS